MKHSRVTRARRRLSNLKTQYSRLDYKHLMERENYLKRIENAQLEVAAAEAEEQEEVK